MKNTLYNRFAALGLSREEQARRIRRIIQNELTELQRYTICAYYFQKKSLVDIAKERGVHPSTVGRTLHRAEEKVKRFLTY